MELLERETLLESLNEYHAASTDGVGSIVFVSGEAGVGKSAVAHHFCSNLPGDSAVYYGFCDAFDAPRALGPLHDIARSGLDGLSTLLTDEPDRHVVFSKFLDLLGAKPSVAVIEDVQWADQATLDLLVFLGRRVAELPAMVVVTLRSDEVHRGHPMRQVLGDLATARAVRRLEVPALSKHAVSQLVGRTGRDVTELYAATGGNSFFVTEVLGAPDEHVPTTVRDAVLARAARLSAGARAVLDLVSMLPIRAEIAMVTSLVSGNVEGPAAAAVDEAVESGMLVRDGDAVWIRHGLACRAIELAVSDSRAAELHRGVLAYLSDSSTVDPARLALHADAAGDSEAVLKYAPAAGALAARLGAHREAADQYRRALRHTAAGSTAQLARLWEGLADSLERSHWTTRSEPGENQLSDALDASANAVELWRTTGERQREVVVMARRSHMLWNAGRRSEAQQTANTAVASLTSLPPGTETARAYAALARLHMLAHDDAGALTLGDVAVTHAERYGDGPTLAEALGVVASTQWTKDPSRAVELLEAGLEAARSSRDDLAAAAIQCNLGAGNAEGRRYRAAEAWLADAVAWCAERDLDSLRELALAWEARCHLEQGRWDQAAEAATAATGVPAARGLAAGVGHAIALTVLGRLRGIRGDPDAAAPLERAWSMVATSGDLRRMWPVAAARAENAWLTGQSERIEGLIGETYRLATQMAHPWAAGELGHWMWVAGAKTDPGARVAAPYALQAAGDWAGSARLWDELGCPYEKALAMAREGDPDRQLSALHHLHKLGAWQSAELIARLLRTRGARNLPRRPRRATRSNPARLTVRELEVLQLLAENLRNSDIAGRLHISAKTVDHHVSAILSKLGVGSRQEAAKWALSTETDGWL